MAASRSTALRSACRLAQNSLARIACSPASHCSINLPTLLLSARSAPGEGHSAFELFELFESNASARGGRSAATAHRKEAAWKAAR